MLHDKLDVCLMPTTTITPYARNPRKIDSAIAKVQASIKEYGFRQPIVVDKDKVIVVGHVRYQAAINLGLSEIPVHIATSLTDTQIKAYRIADNRTGQDSLWDEDLLRLELEELQQNDQDLALLGFESSELDNFLSGHTDHNADIDDIPAIPDNPITKPGDIWQLGRHYLLCGDSLQTASYLSLLQEKQIDLLLTDPPYNVAYEGKAGRIANDDMNESEFAAFIHTALKQATQPLKAGGAAYVFYSDKEAIQFHQAFARSGLKQQSVLIWKKNQFVLGRQDYHSQHEPILYGWKRGEGKHCWYGGRKQSSLQEWGQSFPITQLDTNRWQIQIGEHLLNITGNDIKIESILSDIICHDKPQSSDLHPTMKPVGLLEKLIKNSSQRGENVLDPFGGSGSTLIACEMLERNAFLIELSPAFCDVIIKRWENLTREMGKRIVN